MVPVTAALRWPVACRSVDHWPVSIERDEALQCAYLTAECRGFDFGQRPVVALARGGELVLQVSLEPQPEARCLVVRREVEVGQRTGPE
jgi:hypothetical protein